MNNILIVAHAPFARALRECALHVFPDAGDAIASFDVPPDAPREQTLAAAHDALATSGGAARTLVLTDIVGATPCNVMQQLVDESGAQLIAGVNLPMLLRAWCYRGEPLDEMAQRALAGGMQGVIQLKRRAPENQP